MNLAVFSGPRRMRGHVACVCDRQLGLHAQQVRRDDLEDIVLGNRVQVDGWQHQTLSFVDSYLVRVESPVGLDHESVQRVRNAVVGAHGCFELLAQQPSWSAVLVLRHQLVRSQECRLCVLIHTPIQEHVEQPSQRRVGWVVAVVAPAVTRLVPERAQIRGRSTGETREQVLLGKVQIRGRGVHGQTQDPSTDLSLEGHGPATVVSLTMTEVVHHLGPQSDQVLVASCLDGHQVGEHVALVHLPVVPLCVLDHTVDDRLGPRPFLAIHVDCWEGLLCKLASAVQIDLLELRITLDQLVQFQRSNQGAHVAPLTTLPQQHHVDVWDLDVASSERSCLLRIGSTQSHNAGRQVAGPVLIGIPRVPTAQCEGRLNDRSEEVRLTGTSQVTHCLFTQNIDQVVSVSVDNVSPGLDLVVVVRVANHVVDLGDVTGVDHLGRGRGHHVHVARHHSHHGRDLVAPFVEEELGAAVGVGVVAVSDVDLGGVPLLVLPLQVPSLLEGIELGDRIRIRIRVLIVGVVVSPPDVLAPKQRLEVGQGDGVRGCDGLEHLTGIGLGGNGGDLRVHAVVPLSERLGVREDLVDLRLANLTRGRRRGRGLLVHVHGHRRGIQRRAVLDLGTATSDHKGQNQGKAVHVRLL